MELSVVGGAGIPERSVLAIRYGSTRRQSPLVYPTSFKLPSVPRPAQLDLLCWRAWNRSEEGLSKLDEDGCCKIPLQSMDGRPMSVTLRVVDGTNPSCARAESAIELKSEKAAAKEAEIDDYLAQYKLHEYMRCLFQALLREQPDDPLEFIRQSCLVASQEMDPPLAPEQLSPTNSPVTPHPDNGGYLATFEAPLKSAIARKCSSNDSNSGAAQFKCRMSVKFDERPTPNVRIRARKMLQKANSDELLVRALNAGLNRDRNDVVPETAATPSSSSICHGRDLRHRACKTLCSAAESGQLSAVLKTAMNQANSTDAGSPESESHLRESTSVSDPLCGDATPDQKCKAPVAIEPLFEHAFAAPDPACKSLAPVAISAEETEPTDTKADGVRGRARAMFERAAESGSLQPCIQRVLGSHGRGISDERRESDSSKRATKLKSRARIAFRNADSLLPVLFQVFGAPKSPEQDLTNDRPETVQAKAPVAIEPLFEHASAAPDPACKSLAPVAISAEEREPTDTEAGGVRGRARAMFERAAESGSLQPCIQRVFGSHGRGISGECRESDASKKATELKIRARTAFRNADSLLTVLLQVFGAPKSSEQDLTNHPETVQAKATLAIEPLMEEAEKTMEEFEPQSKSIAQRKACDVKSKARDMFAKAVEAGSLQTCLRSAFGLAESSVGAGGASSRRTARLKLRARHSVCDAAEAGSLLSVLVGVFGTPYVHSGASADDVLSMAHKKAPVDDETFCEQADAHETTHKSVVPGTASTWQLTPAAGKVGCVRRKARDMLQRAVESGSLHCCLAQRLGHQPMAVRLKMRARTTLKDAQSASLLLPALIRVFGMTASSADSVIVEDSIAEADFSTETLAKVSSADESISIDAGTACKSIADALNSMPPVGEEPVSVETLSETPERAPEHARVDLLREYAEGPGTTCKSLASALASTAKFEKDVAVVPLSEKPTASETPCDRVIVGGAGFDPLDSDTGAAETRSDGPVVAKPPFEDAFEPDSARKSLALGLIPTPGPNACKTPTDGPSKACNTDCFIPVKKRARATLRASTEADSLIPVLRSVFKGSQISPRKRARLALQGSSETNTLVPVLVSVFGSAVAGDQLQNAFGNAPQHFAENLDAGECKSSQIFRNQPPPAPVALEVQTSDLVEKPPPKEVPRELDRKSTDQHEKIIGKVVTSLGHVSAEVPALESSEDRPASGYRFDETATRFDAPMQRCRADTSSILERTEGAVSRQGDVQNCPRTGERDRLTRIVHKNGKFVKESMGPSNDSQKKTSEETILVHKNGQFVRIPLQKPATPTAKGKKNCEKVSALNKSAELRRQVRFSDVGGVSALPTPQSRVQGAATLHRSGSCPAGSLRPMPALSAIAPCFTRRAPQGIFPSSGVAFFQQGLTVSPQSQPAQGSIAHYFMPVVSPAIDSWMHDHPFGRRRGVRPASPQRMPRGPCFAAPFQSQPFIELGSSCRCPASLPQNDRFFAAPVATNNLEAFKPEKVENCRDLMDFTDLTPRLSNFLPPFSEHTPCTLEFDDTPRLSHLMPDFRRYRCASPDDDASSAGGTPRLSMFTPSREKADRGMTPSMAVADDNASVAGSPRLSNFKPLGSACSTIELSEFAVPPRPLSSGRYRRCSQEGLQRHGHAWSPRSLGSSQSETNLSFRSFKLERFVPDTIAVAQPLTPKLSGITPVRVEPWHDAKRALSSNTQPELHGMKIACEMREFASVDERSTALTIEAPQLSMFMPDLSVRLPDLQMWCD